MPQNVLVMIGEPSAGDDDTVGGSQQALANDVESLSGDDAREQRDELVEQRARLYADLQESVLAAVGGSGNELLFQYTNLPFLYMRVPTLEALAALVSQPEVVRIYEDTEYEHQLTQSLPLIHQPEVQAAGKVGANTAVAVLDTGCDYTRTAFGSCSSAGAAGCKVAFAKDFATNDSALDDNGHGTNVSAIVLGVAPSTKILALDVFSGPTAPGSSILSAIDWTITNRNTYNIVAMNMSLGGGSYSSPCSSDFFSSAVSNARSAGILSAIASGNNGYASALASPACVPSAISVGAVYDANVGSVSYSACSDSSTAADKITCFSNSASFLSVLAPGAPISAGGWVMTGTSQASPHVAGALAVLRGAFPNEPLADTVTRITDNGPLITDSRNSVKKRRLDLQAALSATGVDITPPSGTLQIEAGAAAVKLASVTLSISSSDSTQMCVSNTTTCTTFSAFQASLSWTLPSGDGIKTVYVTLKDAAGNVAKISDTIVRDAKAPTNPIAQATAGNAKVDFTWSAATDAGSGVAGYKIVYAVGSKPANCNSGTLAWSGNALSGSHNNATNGTEYSYRLCAYDTAGNLGTGVVLVARPKPESNAPSGSVQIQGGAAWTKNPAVTLTLSASDDSAVASMCLSNLANKCTSFVPYAVSKTWNLSATGTVYVWFRDSWGNTSASPVSDSISIDKTSPSMGSLTATPSAGRVSLSWTAASDAGSGLSAYKLVWAKSTSAPACTAGTLAYTGLGTAYSHTGLTAGKYSYRLCATDVAGNTSAGLTKTIVVP
ncbi:MAG TPA: S8 family serine peptidase [Polyangiales bacterium]|nr:S8 family serine peptidase [Polyangiales bacterium]